MKEHTHDYKFVPKGPANFNVKIGGNQTWKKCACGSMTLSAPPKRVSKFRKKKK